MFVLSPAIVFGAYNDVSLGSSAVITLGSSNISVTGSSSVIASIVVSSGSFVATMNSGSSLSLSSSDRYVISASANNSNYREASSCTSSAFTNTFTATGDTELTISIGSSACSSSSSSSSSSGGGGGVVGGGSGVAPVVSRPQTVYPDGTIVYHDVPVVTPVYTQSTPTVTPTVNPVTSSASAVFTNILRRGSTNDDVRRLQSLLAIDPSVYPEATVSGYFGPMTEKAVQRFQAKYGVVSSGDALTTGYGLVGAKTRQKLQEVFGNVNGTVLPANTETASAVNSTASSPVFSSVITRTMSTGAEGEEVRLLQQILNRDPDTRVTDSGIGSPGNESMRYGALTRGAVGKFQEKYNIAMPGDPGYGRVGPKTLLKLSEISR